MNDPIDRLIVHLESAPAGSPELSRDILMALGWRWECIGCPGGGMWKDSRQTFHCGPLPAVSERTEAARALIPENIFIAVHEETQDRWEVQLHTHPLKNLSDYNDPFITTVARTLPLALCAAAIRLHSFFGEFGTPGAELGESQ